MLLFELLDHRNLRQICNLKGDFIEENNSTIGFIIVDDDDVDDVELDHDVIESLWNKYLESHDIMNKGNWFITKHFVNFINEQSLFKASEIKRKRIMKWE